MQESDTSSFVTNKSLQFIPLKDQWLNFVYIKEYFPIA
jgi:hypothetical protein